MKKMIGYYLVDDESIPKDTIDKSDNPINKEPVSDKDISAGELKVTKEYIEDFLTTIDMNKIIKEVSTAGAQGGAMVDDGPSAMMGGKAGYFGRNKKWAEKLGFEVVNYILDVDVSKIPPFKDELSGGKPTSYLPAGIGTELQQIIQKI